MKKSVYLLISLSILFIDKAYSQKGKDGAETITANTIVNEYTTLTMDAAAGSTLITVNNSALNDSSRFANPLSAGDLIMIIQMQGAAINGTAADSTWGAVTAYNNCGLYEFSEVSGTPNGTTINIECSLKNNYSVSGGVQVVRVPRYASLTINSGDTLTCHSWDGIVGGIVAFEVSGNTVINAGGEINASGKGFRGGAIQNGGAPADILTFVSYSSDDGGEKGESIAGYQSDYNTYGGMFCRGAPANGGGGGNSANAAGGGGANAGNINGWNGNGNPDTSNPSWKIAWDLEYSGFDSSSSSGGGRGGYGTAWGAGYSPLNTPPFSPDWNTPYGPGNDRPNVGGKGGRPLDYSTGRIFLGGGGGAGHENNNSGGGGGNGGGIIYALSYSIISGNGDIVSNGMDGVSTGAAGGGDGSGGAGAGGTILLNSTGVILTINVSANGGTGGGQSISSAESEGGGGGGGGGYIALSNGSINQQTLGGINGTTNSTTQAAFPPDGATKGDDGLTNQNINGSPFSSINVFAGTDTSICLGASVNLSASGGNTYSWSPAAGLNDTAVSNPVANPTITTVYIVTVSNGSCFSSDSVKVTVNQGVTFTTSPAVDTTVCPGLPVQLLASGATSYSWLPATNLSCTACANPLLTTNDSISYTVTATNGKGCSSTKKIKINIGGSTIPGTISANRDTLCQGNRGELTLSGNSSHSIQWQSSATTGNFANLNGITDTVNYLTPALTQTTYYRVVVGVGACADTSQYLQLFVPPSLTALFNFTKSGSTVTFNSDSSAGKIVSYDWTFGDGGSSNLKNPTHIYNKTDTTYNVCLTIYDGSNCSYTFCTNVTITTGIPLISAQTKWNIYPNPFSNQFFISGKEMNNKIESVEIYDVLGRMVLNEIVGDQYNNLLRINAPNLAQGMYYLKIKTYNTDYLQKLVKQ